MLSRILACFALLTGLSAIGATANASIVEALQCEIGVSADAQDDTSEDHRACEEEVAKNPRGEQGKASNPAKREKRYIRPPILFGVDRAHE